METPTERDCTDFGRIARVTPRGVLRARNEQEVVDALSAARTIGVPLTVRGAGHSCGGQALTTGVLLRNEPGDQPPRLLDDGTVLVAARSRLRQVERYLNARGRTVPVLPDYLDLSVGGTLSVGGYGTDSVVRGALVDHVARIRLITADGSPLECSPTHNAALFGYAMGGLGQAGILETAVLRTMPYKRWTALFTVRHPSLGALVESFAPIAETPDAAITFFRALHSRGRYVSTYGVHASTWREARAVRAPVANAAARVVPGFRRWRSMAVSAWLARFPRHGRLWSDYLLDYQGLATFTTFLERLMQEDAFAGCLQSVYILAVRKQPRAVGFPFEASDACRAPMAFGIGLYSMVPVGDVARLTRIRHAVSQCLDCCVALGGRPYRYGWHEITDERRRALYGDAEQRLRELSRSVV